MKITSLLSLAAAVALVALIGTVLTGHGALTACSTFALLVSMLIATHEYAPRQRVLGSDALRAPDTGVRQKPKEAANKTAVATV